VSRKIEASKAGDHCDIDRWLEAEPLTGEDLQQLVEFLQILVDANTGQQPSSVDDCLQTRLKLKGLDGEIPHRLSGAASMVDTTSYRHPEMNSEVRMAKHKPDRYSNQVLLNRPGDGLNEGHRLVSVAKLVERGSWNHNRFGVGGEAAEPESVFDRAPHGVDSLHKLDNLLVRSAPNDYFSVARIDGEPVITNRLEGWQQLAPG
jgi:hypothetical protein